MAIGSSPTFDSTIAHPNYGVFTSGRAGPCVSPRGRGGLLPGEAEARTGQIHNARRDAGKHLRQNHPDKAKRRRESGGAASRRAEL